MITITKQSGEQIGFNLLPKQEQALRHLLAMPETHILNPTPDQVEIIKSIWHYLHSDYVQTEFYFTFSEDFTQLRKNRYYDTGTAESNNVRLNSTQSERTQQRHIPIETNRLELQTH